MFRLIAILSFFLFLTKKEPDPFIEVLNRLDDPKLQEKLVLFELRGVEKQVDVRFNADELLEYAASFKGTPHRMGGMSKRGIDCSGLLVVVFKKFNIDLPRTAMDQARYGKLVVDEASLQKGDLVFFCKSYKTNKPITHSGIYMGDGEFIHTSSSSGVTVSSLSNPYWDDRFLFGTRLNP